MKYNIVVSLLVSLLIVSGCATSTYSVGNDFASWNIVKIEKGKTTTAQMLKMFGQPYMKTVISADQEKWAYFHSSGTVKAQSYVVGMKAESTGMQRMLDVLIENGTVINYTYTESETPSYKINQ